MKVFAGPADKGIYSPSVQNTLHLTEKLVLDSVPEVSYFFKFYYVPCFIFAVAYFRLIISK
jgi:hypothetical protein